MRAWVTDRVPERAAAPKLVTIVPELPLTAIGKPYKLPLRADAARRAASDALGDLHGVVEVQADLDGGSPVVTVKVDSSADHDAIATVLDQFTTTWLIEPHDG